MKTLNQILREYYLDYFNNYLTIEKFAEHNELTLSEASNVISLGFDLQLRGASGFANATTRPSIAAGGTFVSTASIATVNIQSGNILQGDVASVGANGFVTQITIQAGTD